MPRHPTRTSDHAIGKGCWSDYESPGYIRGEGDVVPMFGAQVGWPRVREEANPYTCSRCGGKGAIFSLENPDGAIPIPFTYDPARYAIVEWDVDPLVKSQGVCAGCARWAKDDWLLRHAAHEPAAVEIKPDGLVPIAV